MATATYDLIASQTLGAAAASITFSSIAASWTDLRLVLVATSALSSSSPAMRFNADSGANYSYTSINANGSAAISASNYARPFAYLVWYSGTATGIPIFTTADIFSYAGSTYKTYLSTGSNDQNVSGGVERDVGLWRSTAAITSITIFLDSSANFNIGTTAQLYGIKSA